LAQARVKGNCRRNPRASDAMAFRLPLALCLGALAWGAAVEEACDTEDAEEMVALQAKAEGKEKAGAKGEHKAKDCVDIEWAWKNGVGCFEFQKYDWCTTSGGTGSGWYATWGTIQDYSHDGYDATQACCACGGGTSTTAPCEDGKTRFADCSYFVQKGSCDTHKLYMEKVCPLSCGFCNRA